MRTKSEVVMKYAKKHGLKVKKIKLSKVPVADLVGTPKLNPWKPGKPSDSLFLDEINRVSPSLQRALNEINRISPSLILGVKPTLKDWVTYAKEQKVDPGIIAFVKKNGLQYARSAMHMNDLFTGLRSAAEEHFGDKLAGKVSVELKFVKKGKKHV